jgi:hypothetical protein
MQDHRERYSGEIRTIEQSQQQLIQLINSSDPINSADNFENDVQNIVKLAFPAGDWPDDLAPWPSTRIAFAFVLRAYDRLVDSLKQGVRGYLSLERRTGAVWIHHLFNMLQIFTGVATLSGRDAPWGKSGFPVESRFWDVIHGYLHLLRLGAIKTFGADAPYTKAVELWYQECMRDLKLPGPETGAFFKRFKRAQSQLLLWAGVAENKGISLT